MALTGELITLSRKELDRVKVIEAVESKHISQKQAAKQLSITTRQVRRLQHDYRRAGAEGLASKRRGQPSNNRLNDELRSRIEEILRQKYPDFGPTLAQEKLWEVEGVKVSVETLRQQMIEMGLWQPKSRKAKRVFQTRARRACFGELIQIDGSPHAWFELRGDYCTLLVFIDDATGEIVGGRFCPTETTEGYMSVLRDYVDKYGRPVSLYSDKHGVFKVNAKDAVSGSGLTQFGRAVETLDIELIHAHTPQAKGRVERANQTLQDRLVKELRLRGIDDIDTANAFLPEFIADFNRRFGRPAKDNQDAHRPVLHTPRELDLIFSIHGAGKVSKSLEVQHDNIIYQIQEPRHQHRLKGQSIVLAKQFDGSVVLLWQGRELQYQALTVRARRVQLETGKTINHRVDETLKQQAERPSYKPSVDHPWRKPLKPRSVPGVAT